MQPQLLTCLCDLACMELAFQAEQVENLLNQCRGIPGGVFDDVVNHAVSGNLK